MAWHTTHGLAFPFSCLATHQISHPTHIPSSSPIAVLSRQPPQLSSGTKDLSGLVKPDISALSSAPPILVQRHPCIPR